MAKAHITTQNGCTIVIEGTAQEVALLMARYDGQSTVAAASTHPSTSTHGDKRPTGKTKVKGSGKKKVTATSLINEMIEGGSFNKPKGMGDVKKELEQGGHYFTDAGVATPLLRAVKKRRLRRIKRDNTWTYVV